MKRFHFFFFKDIRLSVGLLVLASGCSPLYHVGLQEIPSLTSNKQAEISASAGLMNQYPSCQVQAAWSPFQKMVVTGTFSAYAKTGKDFRHWDSQFLSGEQWARGQGGYHFTLGGGWYRFSPETNRVVSLTGGFGFGLSKNSYYEEDGLIVRQDETRSTPKQLFFQYAAVRYFSKKKMAFGQAIRLDAVSFRSLDMGSSYGFLIKDEDFNSLNDLMWFLEPGFFLRFREGKKIKFQVQTVFSIGIGPQQKGAFLPNFVGAGSLGGGIVYHLGN